MTVEPNKSEVIVEVGGEGGSITLYGVRTERGWCFSRESIDWTPELLDEERVHKRSSVVDNWEAALDLLDRYPWPKLVPIAVHPEFGVKPGSPYKSACKAPTGGQNQI
jgi:hypothetical protein